MIAMTIWRVYSGTDVRWFETEKEARAYARELFDDIETKSIPFLNFVELSTAGDIISELCFAAGRTA